MNIGLRDPDVITAIDSGSHIALDHPRPKAVG
jgi:hypothetical protein